MIDYTDRWDNSLNYVVTYLIEQGMDEGQVDHFLRTHPFGKRSLMRMIVEDDWDNVWSYIVPYMLGEITP